MKRLGLLLGLALFASTAATAAEIELGAGDPGSVTTLATGGGSAAVSGAMVNGFDITLSGSGVPVLTPPDLLNGNTIDAILAGSAASSVNVWVTSTGNLTPLGTQSLLSSFTQNLLAAGWTVTATTYADNTNAAFGTQQTLASTVFTTSDPPDVLITNTAALGAGPYSITERWFIQAPSAGSTNNTTDITSVVPLPPAMQMFLGGLLLFGGFLWASKKRSGLATA